VNGEAQREEERDVEDPQPGMEEVQQPQAHDVHGHAVGQRGSRLQRAAAQRPRVAGAPQPAQDAADDAEDDRPGQQPEVGRHAALPQDPDGHADATGLGAGARSAWRRTAEVEVQRAVEVVHDPGGQRVAGRIEIWSEDPQAAEHDDGHGEQHDRGEGDASCETSHWSIMARAGRMCRYTTATTGHRGRRPPRRPQHHHDCSHEVPGVGPAGRPHGAALVDDA
jgi:hypothetical protein